LNLAATDAVGGWAMYRCALTGCGKLLKAKVV
jgi:hypothetical protein